MCDCVYRLHFISLIDSEDLSSDIEEERSVKKQQKRKISLEIVLTEVTNVENQLERGCNQTEREHSRDVCV